MRTVVARDEKQEVLVTIYDDGHVDVATRPHDAWLRTWSPPLQVTDDEGGTDDGI